MLTDHYQGKCSHLTAGKPRTPWTLESPSQRNRWWSIQVKAEEEEFQAWACEVPPWRRPGSGHSPPVHPASHGFGSHQHRFLLRSCDDSSASGFSGYKTFFHIIKTNHLIHMNTFFIASPTSCTWLLFGEEEELYLSILALTKTFIRFSSKFRYTYYILKKTEDSISSSTQIQRSQTRPTWQSQMCTPWPWLRVQTTVTGS